MGQPNSEECRGGVAKSGRVLGGEWADSRISRPSSQGRCWKGSMSFKGVEAWQQVVRVVSRRRWTGNCYVMMEVDEKVGSVVLL